MKKSYKVDDEALFNYLMNKNEEAYNAEISLANSHDYLFAHKYREKRELYEEIMFMMCGTGSIEPKTVEQGGFMIALESYEDEENNYTYELFKEKFPDRLKQCLGNAGMTQRELAAAIHVAETTVSKYINGMRVPKAPTITAMARALKVTEHSLLSFGFREEN